MAILRFLLLLYLTYFETITSTNIEGNDLDVIINSINDIKNYISKMKELESKLAQIEDLQSKVDKVEELESKIAQMEVHESKVANMDNPEQRDNKMRDLESKVSKIDDLESKVSKMEDLETKISKMEDLARVGTLRTCAEYSQYGITTDGLYVVDPDGVLNGEPPFEVFCNFTDGSTQILHDTELLTDIDHCNDPGCFNKPIKYRDGTDGPLVPLSQLEALITLSESCSQEFVYQCTLAPLKDHLQHYAFWEDRTGETNYYFHGSHKNSHSCACHYTDEGCEQSMDKGNACSCDANIPVPLEDTGIITNMTALPIMTIYFGGLRYPKYQNAKFRLGRLKCTGKAEFEEGNSCSALKKEGVMRSGLYTIKKDGASHTSLVHCNMTGDGYDNVPEVEEVSSSSPLGTIAAWVSKVGADSYVENIPDGWLPCDGTTITKGPWAGGKTPDLNTMGRFLRGGTEEEILTLEDHQVEDHGHIDKGHSHTTSAHTHSNTPHTHSNSPHTHSNTPHTHSNSPHKHSNSPHTHTNSPHTHENSAHSHSNSPHSHGYKDTYASTWGGRAGRDGDHYVWSNSPYSKTTKSASINIDSSSVNIETSTVNTQSSSVNIDPSTVNIEKSSVNINPATVNTQSSSVNIATSTVNVHSSNAGLGGISSSSNSGDETRPINARVIWIMRVY